MVTLNGSPVKLEVSRLEYAIIVTALGIATATLNVTDHSTNESLKRTADELTQLMEMFESFTSRLPEGGLQEFLDRMVTIGREQTQ